MLGPMDGYEHPLLYSSGTGRASQETAISGFCQQVLAGIHNSVWFFWMFMGWIPRWGSLWIVIPSVSASHFVSPSLFTPSMGKFPLLRGTLFYCWWDCKLVQPLWKSVWWLFMGWIPRWGSLWMVIPSDSALNFVSVTLSMGIFFPILRRSTE